VERQRRLELIRFVVKEEVSGGSGGWIGSKAIRNFWELR